VWDAATGAKQYTFEGHEAPVYSVCPHYKENIQVKCQCFSDCSSAAPPKRKKRKVGCAFMIVNISCSFVFMCQFIFSTAVDGKIKAWLYDNLGSRVDYDAPGRWCTTMAYSQDGTRLIHFCFRDVDFLCPFICLCTG